MSKAIVDLAPEREAMKGGRLRRWAVPFCLGVLLTFSFEPYGLWPVLFVALPGLFMLLRRAISVRQAFFTGWLFGFGHHLLGLYWVSHSMLVEPEKFAWLIPFSVSLLPAGMALFIGGAAALYKRFETSGPLAVLFFATCWTAFEWLRSWLFTGFPWNMLAQAWGASLSMLQSLSLVGELGLSFITVACCAMVALLAYDRHRRTVAVVGSALAVLVGLFLFGAWRLSEYPMRVVEGQRVRLVQPNIDQRDKWNPALRDKHLLHMMQLSSQATEPGKAFPNLIIWPETATPFFVEYDRRRRAAAASIIPHDGYLLTGTPSIVKPEEKGQRPLVYNALLALDSLGRVQGRYNKQHLVPFGEFVPFANLIRALKLDFLLVGGLGFTPGDGATVVDIPGVPPFRPLICYEAIFTREIIDGSGRVEWLLNVTNDAWFGDTAGPYQHVLMTRMRAIELGLPMVRSANTGISAAYDSLGRELAKVPLLDEGVVDFDLPSRLSQGTMYSILNLWPLIMLNFFVCLLTFLRVRK